MIKKENPNLLLIITVAFFSGVGSSISAVLDAGLLGSIFVGVSIGFGVVIFGFILTGNNKLESIEEYLKKQDE